MTRQCSGGAGNCQQSAVRRPGPETTARHGDTTCGTQVHRSRRHRLAIYGTTHFQVPVCLLLYSDLSKFVGLLQWTRKLAAGDPSFYLQFVEMTEANVELLISRHQSERFKLSARDGGSLLADLLMDNLQNPVPSQLIKSPSSGGWKPLNRGSTLKV